MRRLNRYVEEQAPWKLAKDEAQARALDQVLYGLAEGIRVVCGAAPSIHADVDRAAARGARADGDDALSLERAQPGAVAGGATDRQARAALPEDRGGRDRLSAAR